MTDLQIYQSAVEYADQKTRKAFGKSGPFEQGSDEHIFWLNRLQEFYG